MAKHTSRSSLRRRLLVIDVALFALFGILCSVISVILTLGLVGDFEQDHYHAFASDETSTCEVVSGTAVIIAQMRLNGLSMAEVAEKILIKKVRSNKLYTAVIDANYVILSIARYVYEKALVFSLESIRHMSHEACLSGELAPAMFVPKKTAARDERRFFILCGYASGLHESVMRCSFGSKSVMVNV